MLKTIGLNLIKLNWVQLNSVPRIIVLITLLMSGCELGKTLESSGLVKRPTVALQQLSLVGVDAEGVAFNLGVAVNNPNAIALQLADIGYQLQVNGKPLVSGRQSDGFSLKANDTSLLQVPIRLSFQDMGQLAMSFLQPGANAMPYVLDTQIAIKLPGLGNVPFKNQQSGQLPLPNLSRF